MAAAGQHDGLELPQEMQTVPLRVLEVTCQPALRHNCLFCAPGGHGTLRPRCRLCGAAAGLSRDPGYQLICLSSVAASGRAAAGQACCDLPDRGFHCRLDLCRRSTRTDCARQQVCWALREIVVTRRSIPSVSSGWRGFVPHGLD